MVEAARYAPWANGQFGSTSWRRTGMEFGSGFRSKLRCQKQTLAGRHLGSCISNSLFQVQGSITGRSMAYAFDRGPRSAMDSNEKRENDSYRPNDSREK